MLKLKKDEKTQRNTDISEDAKVKALRKNVIDTRLQWNEEKTHNIIYEKIYNFVKVLYHITLKCGKSKNIRVL